MKATTELNENKDQVYQLNLSFSEMHFIMKAMSEYSNNGYSPRNQTASESHSLAAEKLHDELLEIYEKNLQFYR